jgi:hypothetical protein
MIGPDLINELEWEQLKDWGQFITLLRARTASLINENARLTQRIHDMETRGPNPRSGPPERGPPRDTRIR